VQPGLGGKGRKEKGIRIIVRVLTWGGWVKGGGGPPRMIKKGVPRKNPERAATAQIPMGRGVEKSRSFTKKKKAKQAEAESQKNRVHDVAFDWWVFPKGGKRKWPFEKKAARRGRKRKNIGAKESRELPAREGERCRKNQGQHRKEISLNKREGEREIVGSVVHLWLVQKKKGRIPWVETQARDKKKIRQKYLTPKPARGKRGPPATISPRVANIIVTFTS